ncbi:hypothetical protein THRCLA_11748 [Thraustotheca clavata]|uniref:K-box domain-containing protein n=1 Tax=Thraustotheca clavata TaxID=74557 RepID=A0A1V9Y6V8_9STRA|nr:hypothetical protein THRCLA_11748 [Thraustotheca clavata]
MHSSPSSACCIATCIALVLSLVLVLCLTLLYWTLPRVPAAAHDFSKISAQRFATSVELMDASPIPGEMNNILMSWSNPLCEMQAIPAGHNSLFGDSTQDARKPRFHVQYWTQGSWLSGFGSFNHIALAVSSPDSLVDGGDLYSDDCFVVLENAKYDVTYSFRVRSRVETAMFQLFTRQWTSWSDTIAVPPYEPENETSEWSFLDDTWYTDRRTWVLCLLTIGAIVYALAMSKDRVKPTVNMKILEEEVANLKQELADAEMENKLLMRLKGYDVDQLSIEELEELENELTRSLVHIAEVKDAII